MAGGNGGIGARRKHGEDGRFKIVPWRYACPFNGSLLAVFPVVVLFQQNTIAIAQFESRIRYGIFYPGLGQGGSNRADQHLSAAIIPAQNEPTNDNIVAGTD